MTIYVDNNFVFFSMQCQFFSLMLKTPFQKLYFGISQICILKKE